MHRIEMAIELQNSAGSYAFGRMQPSYDRRRSLMSGSWTFERKSISVQDLAQSIARLFRSSRWASLRDQSHGCINQPLAIERVFERLHDAG